MLPYTVARKVWLSFALSLAALAFLALQSLIAVRGLASAALWVAHTQEVIAAIARLRSDAGYAETSQRGALLTAQAPYLLAYEKAKRESVADLQRLRRLTADNPAQQRNLSDLEPVLRQRFLIADRALALPSLAAAQRELRRGTGDRVMRDLFARLDAMHAEETSLLRQRQSRSERQTTRALGLIGFGSLAAIGLLAWSTRGILRGLEQRVALEEEIARFFLLSVDMLCIAGFDGRFERLSPAWTRVLGYRLEELVGRPFIDFVHPDDKERTAAETADIAGGRKTINFENRYRHKDGSYVWLRWSANGSKDERQIYAVARDVTEEHALHEARRELAHHVNHELRNPTAAISLALSMLREGPSPLDETQRKTIDLALGSAEHLKRMTDDLLDATRLETGKLRVNLESVDLTASLRNYCAAMAESAAARGITLAFEAGPPVMVAADPTRLRQIVCNLLDNALKFTPKGGRVAVTAELDGHGARVAVADTGPGIPAADLERVFDRLYQTSRTAKDGTRGLGLGLAICKELVERMGGRIWAESEPGRGARLLFTLPRA